MRSRLAPALLVLVPLAGAARGELPPGRAMRTAGLVEISERSLPGGVVLWRGLLPGRDGGRVVLFGGCGPGLSRSASAAGREVVLAAVADLARTPRRHDLEVLLCADAPAGPSASLDWLERNPGAAANRVLAALHLEPTAAGQSLVLRLLPAESARGRRLPPAWLAHAMLAGARAAGVEAVAGGRPSLPAQLAARWARPCAASGAEPLLGAGVPALALAVAAGPAGAGSRRDGWARATTAAVRRLDGLAGRPLAEDRYLVALGRVWLRRDLYWVGFLVWVAQVLRGLPGAWRGAAGTERRRRGRRYLPGFAFRMAYLVTLFAAPVATVLLLVPAALMTLLPVRTRTGVLVARSVALVPALLFAGYLAVHAAAGRLDPRPAEPGRTLLVTATLAMGCGVIGRRSSPPPAPPG